MVPFLWKRELGVRCKRPDGAPKNRTETVGIAVEGVASVILKLGRRKMELEDGFGQFGLGADKSSSLGHI